MTGIISVLLVSLAHAGTTDYALPVVPVSTQPVTLALVTERLTALDAGLKTLTSDFEQSVRWDESGTRQTIVGALEYRKKDKLRVEHKLPEAQTIVADGDTLWVFRESTNQVIKTKLSDWKKTEPLAQGLLDLGNYASLMERYAVRLATAADAGGGYKNVALELRPKDDKENRFTLTLRLSTKDYFPTETELRVGGVVVRSTFKKIRYNPVIPDARFAFKPPEGADVFQK